MQSPFTDRIPSLSGPATDLFPVVPADGIDLPAVAIALYIETGGTITVQSVAGFQRQVEVADFSFLPLGVRRVEATGTTASGIHALMVHKC